MRRATAMFLALLFLQVPLNTQAQNAGVELEILRDESGDAVYYAMDVPADSQPTDAALDLIAFYITESPEELEFRVQVQDLGSESQKPVLGEGRIDINFQLGDETVVYVPDEDDVGNTEPLPAVTVPRDRFQLSIQQQSGDARAFLSQFDNARNQYVPYYTACTRVGCDGSMEIMLEEASWLVPIPRTLLLDADGSAPNPAVRLHSFQLTSSSDLNEFSLGLADIRDEMPDGGNPAGEFVPEIGLPLQTGNLRLHSPVPVRWSNGEETTYVYDIVLQKLDDVPETARMSVVGVPDGWDVQIPAESLSLESARNISMSVILKTPFSHEHGAFQSFIVEVKGEHSVDAKAQVELGIRYSNVPQPTGHHSMQWVHGAESPAPGTLDTPRSDGQRVVSRQFMSAMDPKDQPGSVEALIGFDTTQGSDLNRAQYSWILPLEPPLKTGLDFDVSRLGEVNFEFLTDLDAEDAVIFGELYYRLPRSEPTSDFDHRFDRKLALFYSSQKTTLVAGESQILSAQLKALPAGDFLRYRPEGAYVFMQVTLRFNADPEFLAGGQTFGPWMVPGGTIDLPLDEYHDPIEKFYRPLNQVSITEPDVAKQFVNPGEAVAFEFTVKNTGIANEVFDLQMTSLGKDWATILGKQSIAIPSDSQQLVQVVVSAPKDAWQGQIVGPLFEVVSQNDPLAKASARVHVEVDKENNHPDSSHLLGVPTDGAETTSIPTGGLVPLMAALAGLVAVRRTRRL